MLYHHLCFLFALLLLGSCLLAYPQDHQLLLDLDVQSGNNSTAKADDGLNPNNPSINSSKDNHVEPTSTSDKPVITNDSETTPYHTTESTPTHELTRSHEPTSSNVNDNTPTYESVPSHQSSESKSSYDSKPTKEPTSGEIIPTRSNANPSADESTPTTGEPTKNTSATPSGSQSKTKDHPSTITSITTVTNKHGVTTKHIISTIDPTIPNSSDLSEKASGRGRTIGIAVGVSVGIAAVLGAIGIWIFRKWKLSPSRNFRAKLRNNDHFRPPTHSILERESNTVFLRELNE